MRCQLPENHFKVVSTILFEVYTDYRRTLECPHGAQIRRRHLEKLGALTLLLVIVRLVAKVRTSVQKTNPGWLLGVCRDNHVPYSVRRRVLLWTGCRDEEGCRMTLSTRSSSRCNRGAMP